VETVYVLAGESVLTLGETETPFAAGQIVAIPAELPHTLRNDGPEMVELLCFFTPPLV
jgi:quercetin dioxygenase-like cupin family protein